MFSIDYSFIVSALALRCKEFIKFYNWNVQRMMQKLKIKMDSYFWRTGYLNIEQWYIQIRHRIAYNRTESKKNVRIALWFMSNVLRLWRIEALSMRWLSKECRKMFSRENDWSIRIGKVWKLSNHPRVRSTPHLRSTHIRIKNSRHFTVTAIM